MIVLTPEVTAASVSQPNDLLVMARFGVGYDSVDVKACTAADVLVTITTGAVDRPVAEAALGWMIALGHNFRIKDGLVRTGKWDERSKYMGRELRDRTLGVIGFGGIAQKLVELLRGFGMEKPIAFDPFAKEATAAKLGVKLVGLDELLNQADFVSIHCPLTEKTRGVARGARTGVDETGRIFIVERLPRAAALWTRTRCTRRSRRCGLAGAALDCFCGRTRDQAASLWRI